MIEQTQRGERSWDLSVEAIARDPERDNFLSAEEARSYGLIDTVLITAQKS